MSVLPEWSERIDERGMPIDPLNSNSSRNRVANLFAHGLITSITLRLRYVSIFCWALDRLGEEPDDDPYGQLKNIEKLFCLASRYRALHEGHDGALRGMDGNSRFSYDDEEFDEVVLDDLELLKNDGYAYSQFYENLLQKFMLKRGEFELTAAGHELADIVDGHIGADRDRILRCAREGRAERADFEAFSRTFANQSLYLEPEFEDERHALQKVLLGFTTWEGDKQTGTVELAEQIPSELSLDVLDQLYETIESGEMEEAGASKLYQKYHRGYHRYRGANVSFLLRSWQLQSDTPDGQLSLSEEDRRNFRQYRDLMRIYWLQVYAGYAVEAQLEALCAFLNSRIPTRYDYATLLERATDESRLHRAFTSVTGEFEIQQGTEEASPKQQTRNLMLYGATESTKPIVDVPESESGHQWTLGDAITEIESSLPTSWDDAPPVSGGAHLNEVLLAKTVRESLNELRENIDDEAQQFEYWAESLARSLALLLMTVIRFKRVQEEREWFYNYAFNRLDSRYNSLSELTRVITRADDDTPLAEFAQKLLENQVVETQLQVFYSRLSPGNLKRALSFDQDGRICLEVDKERGERPFRATPTLIRFSEMNTFARDAGLLIETDDGYEPTSQGIELLSRVDGGGDS